MDVTRLVETDKTVAVEGVRFHIARYWEPRMRKAIIAHVGAGAAGLAPTAADAIRKLVPPP